MKLQDTSYQFVRGHCYVCGHMGREERTKKAICKVSSPYFSDDKIASCKEQISKPYTKRDYTPIDPALLIIEEDDNVLLKE